VKRGNGGRGEGGKGEKGKRGKGEKVKGGKVKRGNVKRLNAKRQNGSPSLPFHLFTPPLTGRGSPVAGVQGEDPFPKGFSP
jgi:hypothetical protein